MDLPEEYKKGYKDFLNAKIDLSKRPLIPRDETSYWVEIVINEIKKENKEFHCLDLFSGSGCVGISILKNINNCFCDFGEINDDFIEQIKINLGINGVNGKIIKTDVFSNIDSSYDYILANPPYVADERWEEVGEDVKMFEPKLALLGGTRGMNLIRRFLKEAKTFLKDNGKIFMELDEDQMNDIEEIVKDKYSSYQFFKDQFGKYRFIRIEK
ncbi:MAG: class I SAM-dependent methyltransferase [Candidatus Pacebacteria bacterium]|nr:class I SAM-dependent methyltransferase [Candidatus Paceibacterota bacterium]